MKNLSALRLEMPPLALGERCDPMPYDYNSVRYMFTKTAPGSDQREIDPFEHLEGFRFDGLLGDEIFRRAALAAIYKCVEINKTNGHSFKEEFGGAGDFGLIVELDPDDPAKPAYRLTVGPQVEHPNNWAEGKLAWLKMLHKYYSQPYTSPMKREEFVSLVNNLVSLKELEDCVLEQAYGYTYNSAGDKLASTDELPDQCVMLLSMSGVVPFYGAFCYECGIAISTNNGLNQQSIFKGTISISFSGAKQKRDLQFAMEVFKAMHDEFTGGPFSSLVYGYGFEIKGWPDTVEDEYFAQLWQGTMRELGQSI